MCLIPTRPCYKNQLSRETPLWYSIHVYIYNNETFSAPLWHPLPALLDNYYSFFCQIFPETLLKLVKGNRKQPLSTLVFCRNAKTVCFVGLFLKENGVNSSVLHADMPQRVLAVIFVTSPGHAQSDRSRKKKNIVAKKLLFQIEFMNFAFNNNFYSTCSKISIKMEGTVLTLTLLSSTIVVFNLFYEQVKSQWSGIK